MTTWHNEKDYQKLSINLAEKLKKIFPQIKLIVNEFEPVRIDQYEVYLKIPFFSKNFDPLI